MGRTTGVNEGVGAPAGGRGWRRLLVLLVAFAVAACGGGGGDSGVGSGGTGFSGTQIGTVNGFGSVIVEGTRYDDSGASYSVDVDPSAPRTGTAADARLGMQVEVAFDASDRAQSVRISAEVIGPVERLTADGFVAAGQTVRIAVSGTLPTVLAGIADLGDLAVGDRVEVYGQRDASGVVVATRVERIDGAAAAVTRVVGTVSAVDATARTLQIGTLTVVQNGATVVLPVGTTIAVGQRVAVWAAALPASGRLTAAVVRVLSSSPGESASVRVGGVVRALDRGTTRFRIADVEVDAASASFVNGTLAELAELRVVRVRGTFTGSRLKATEVQYVRAEVEAKAEVTGVIADFVSSASFVVRGTPVNASGSGVTFGNGSAANLTNGVLVKVEGTLVSGVLQASKVELQTGNDSRTTAFLGLVSGYNAASGEFSLLGVAMRLAAGASFSLDDGGSASRADFGNGLLADVRGSFQAGTFVVTEVELRASASGKKVKVEGAAYAVDLASRRMRVDGASVRWTAATQIDGALVELRGGTTVRVEGTVVGADLVATRITIRP